MIPAHVSLQHDLDDWIAAGWEEHVGRAPQDDDFLFPDETGEPFREERCIEFLDDVRASGCETRVKGLLLDIYSLRHTFATTAKRFGVDAAARDRLLGHRPKDTKAMHYEDEDLPVLAAEIAKLPDLLAPLPAVRETAGHGHAMVTGKVHASGGTSVSLMIREEEMGFEPMEPLQARRFSKPLP